MKNIDKKNIVMGLKADNKDEVIKMLSQLLFKNRYIDSLDIFYKVVLEREREFSTSIGRGVAIPHGKTDVVKQSTFAFAKLQKPIIWTNGDTEAVEIVFLLAVDNEGAKNKHLEMLAEIAEKLMNDEFLDSLKKARNEKEVSKILEV